MTAVDEWPAKIAVDGPESLLPLGQTKRAAAAATMRESAVS